MLERGSPREPRALCLTSVYPPGHHMVRRGGVRLRGRGESALLCAPLAVGGGARQHSFVSDTLHVARASFFGPWGGVCEPAAEATKGVAVCFISGFLD
jgi:hypothetical protein